MAVPKMYDNWNRPPERIGEVTTDEVVVERAGYIKAKDQIESMILAGVRLGQARKDMYDYEDESQDDGFVDPVRSGADFGDMERIGKEVFDKLETQKSEAERKAKEDAELREKAKDDKEPGKVDLARE